MNNAFVSIVEYIKQLIGTVFSFRKRTNNIITRSHFEIAIVDSTNDVDWN